MEWSQDRRGWEGGVAGELLVGEGMPDESSSGNKEADMSGVVVRGMYMFRPDELDASDGEHVMPGKTNDESDGACSGRVVMSSGSDGPARGIDSSRKVLDGRGAAHISGKEDRSIAASGDACGGT